MDERLRRFNLHAQGRTTPAGESYADAAFFKRQVEEGFRQLKQGMAEGAAQLQAMGLQALAVAVTERALATGHAPPDLGRVPVAEAALAAIAALEDDNGPPAGGKPPHQDRKRKR
jgi:hypothetical protein